MVSFATKNKETKSKEQRINNKDYLKRWIVELSIVYSSRSTCFRPLTLDFRQETFACSRCRTIASCGNNSKSTQYPICFFLLFYLPPDLPHDAIVRQREWKMPIERLFIILTGGGKRQSGDKTWFFLMEKLQIGWQNMIFPNGKTTNRVTKHDFS